MSDERSQLGIGGMSEGKITDMMNELARERAMTKDEAAGAFADAARVERLIGKHGFMGRISYVIPDELHRRMKVLAGRQGRTLKAWHERALEEVVERQGS